MYILKVLVINSLCVDQSGISGFWVPDLRNKVTPKTGPSSVRLVQHPIKWLVNPNSSLWWSVKQAPEPFSVLRVRVNERIPVWVRLCLSRWLRWINLMSHMEQAYGFTPTHTEQYISPRSLRAKYHNFQAQPSNTCSDTEITQPKCIYTIGNHVQPIPMCK